MKNKNLGDQAAEILKLASKQKIEQDFFFKTTFRRYEVQLSLLNNIEKEIRNSALTVEKEYVKGKKNICENPLINEYNKTSDAANRTVTTLVGIITKMKDIPPFKELNKRKKEDNEEGL